MDRIKPCFFKEINYIYRLLIVYSLTSNYEKTFIFCLRIGA
jgi:hypothetical protein